MFEIFANKFSEYFSCLFTGTTIQILGNSRATQFETDRHWNAQRGKMIGCYKRKNSEFVWFRFITFPNRRRFVIETFLSCDFDEVAAFCRHFSLKRHRFLVNRANFPKSIVMESLWLRYKVAVELRHKVSKREKKKWISTNRIASPVFYNSQTLIRNVETQ